MGLVQRMTTGEAEKLLTAKGYLKSRYQALIGTKLPGRVEKMCVEEGMKVKKGDTLAVLEHNDLKAMLASREAQTMRTAAELEEARADLWEKDRENRRVGRLFAQKSATPEESEKGHVRAEEGGRAGRGPRSRRQADEGQCRRDQGDDRHDASVRARSTARSSRSKGRRARSSRPWR